MPVPRLTLRGPLPSAYCDAKLFRRATLAITRCFVKLKWWEWGNEGVDLYEDHLTWVEKETAVRFASGAACDQTLDDVLKRGPYVNGVPADILTAVTQAVRAIQAKRHP